MKTRPVPKAVPSTPTSGGVLCGTDFSPSGDTAVEIATALARKMAVPLTLAHALELAGTFASDEKAVRWLTENRQKGLRKEADVARKSGVSVHEHLAAGRADEMLVKLAKTEKPRLIVLSSLGRRRAGQWLLGSVAERTAERASVPTLILRDATPLRSWVRGRRTLKVFVCFNFSASAEIALRWVKQLMEIGPCEVVLGYVNSPVDDFLRVGAGGPIPFDGNPNEVLAILERDLKERARTHLDGAPARCRVEDHVGRTDKRLAEMAKEEGADLIVTGSRQYAGVQGWWQASVSRGLLSHAGTSVAVVPLAAAKGRSSKLPVPRHVLVATDFSDLGNSAIPHAYSLVRRGGLVTLIHVVAPPPRAALGARSHGKMPRAVAKNAAEETRKITAKLRALIPADAEPMRVLTQVEVVSNRQAGLAIAQAAERLGVDIVCFASRGRSGLTKLLIGSVAEEIITRVRRPLFMVRPPPR